VEQHVALLRGINVGGNNIIAMSTLRGWFEEAGFTNVTTYIQSGNVLFETPERASKIADRVEAMLLAAFGKELRVVVRSRAQMEAIVRGAPDGFGSQPASYRYDVIFLREPLVPFEAMSALRAKEGVDRAYVGEGVCYFDRLIARATDSQLGRVIGTPIYQNMTIRNWNTTKKLLALMDARAAE
jgi:uncharacterized protein (DUF1697 family)